MRKAPTCRDTADYTTDRSLYISTSYQIVTGRAAGCHRCVARPVETVPRSRLVGRRAAGVRGGFGRALRPRLPCRRRWRLRPRACAAVAAAGPAGAGCRCPTAGWRGAHCRPARAPPPAPRGPRPRRSPGCPFDARRSRRVLAQHLDQVRHHFAQHRFQRVRRIQDEHAAAVQAEAVRARRRHGQRDVQPFLGRQALQACRRTGAIPCAAAPDTRPRRCRSGSGRAIRPARRAPCGSPACLRTAGRSAPARGATAAAAGPSGLEAVAALDQHALAARSDARPAPPCAPRACGNCRPGSCCRPGAARTGAGGPLARHLVGHIRRTRVVAHLAARVHALDQVDVFGQRRRQVVRSHSGPMPVSYSAFLDA
jgi:hypothetical protein